MKVDADRLQEGLHLPVGQALRTHRGLSYPHHTEGGGGLQVLHHHRTSRQRGLAVVERDSRAAACEQFLRRTFRQIEEAVDLVLLHRLTCLSHRGIVSHDLRILEAVELTP